jgi:hypothetical protein
MGSPSRAHTHAHARSTPRPMHANADAKLSDLLQGVGKKKGRAREGVVAGAVCVERAARLRFFLVGESHLARPHAGGQTRVDQTTDPPLHPTNACTGQRNT